MEYAPFVNNSKSSETATGTTESNNTSDAGVDNESEVKDLSDSLVGARIDIFKALIGTGNFGLYRVSDIIDCFRNSLLRHLGEVS